MAADNDNDELAARIDRLVSAQEAQTNQLRRLCQLLEQKRATKQQSAQTRMRRVAPTKPKEVDPMVRASVDRALRKAGLK